MNNLQEVQQEVDELVDGLGRPIDAGIKKIVSVLRLIGFHTTASCEGHMDRGLPYPWVQINNNVEFSLRDTAEQQAMQALLSEYFQDRFWDIMYAAPMGIYGGFRLMSYPLITEDGVKDSAIRIFHLYQMNQFADWLMEKYEHSRTSR